MLNKHLLLIASLFFIGLAQAQASAGFSEESLQSLAQALQKTSWEITRTDSGDIVLKPRSQQNTEAEKATTENDGKSPSNAPADVSSLEKALKSAGWETERTDSGDLLLFPKGDAPPLIDTTDETPVQASPAPDIQDSVIDFETLPQRLRSAGWIVEKDHDGSLMIHWPESSVGTTPASGADDSSMDELKQKLEQSGWYVEKTPNGDLLLYPQDPKANAADVSGESANNSNSTVEAAAQAPLDTDAVTDLNELQQRLESVGWITSRDKNGDLVIYWSESEKQGQMEHSGDDLARLIPLLENTGWRVKKSGSGDLLLYPQQPDQDSATGSEAKPAFKTGPVDSDADGVPDENDLCPNSANEAQVDSTGCAVASLVLEGVTFKYSSYRLTPEAKTFLREQAARMHQYPGLLFKITGHTDSRGSAAKNQILSEKRARAVYLYLIEQGVSEDSMVYSGAGESSPLTSNATEEGRERNRRVELSIMPPE